MTARESAAAASAVTSRIKVARLREHLSGGGLDLRPLRDVRGRRFSRRRAEVGFCTAMAERVLNRHFDHEIALATCFSQALATDVTRKSIVSVW